MSELGEKVKRAVDMFKRYEPPEGYWLGFSGGKDSVVIDALAVIAGVKKESHYTVTSVDPPEVVQFIKEKYPHVHRDIPRYKDGKPITMWNLIPKKKMPPTRLVRYCCSSMKEIGGAGRLVVTGVRKAESVARSKNNAEIKILNPPKQLLENVNFYQTPKGGWYY